MGKRIFTKVFSGSVIVAAAPTDEGAWESWLIQYEAIEVIGAQAKILSTMPSENDGFAYAEVELSQVGVRRQEGAILSVAAGEGWNTTPAGINQVNGHQVVTFPAGFAVPVKEEGYLYINTGGRGKSAGDSVFEYEVIVFYTKKGR
ncbi:hypothetical protein ES705_44543 [subsurface metagenome]